MTLRDVWSPVAVKDRDRLDPVARQRILEAIKRFCKTGHGDIKRMQGVAVLYRLRVGDYRIIFQLTTDQLVVKRVAHRREVYRD